MHHAYQFWRLNRWCRRILIANLPVFVLLMVVVDVRAQQNYVANQVIIKMKSGVQTSEVVAMRASLNASVANSFRFINAELWNISGIAVADAIQRYKNDARVEYIEPNYIVSAIRATPNDPNVSQLWGLNNTGQTGGKVDADIDAPEAWNVQTGKKVVVGVIDTGVDWNHEDLADNIWVNSKEIPNNGIDDDGNGYIDDVRGWDFKNKDNDPMDDHGHGTHVSGTIAAVGNNGKGIAGVCWSAQIMPLKFLSASGSGSLADAVSCIEYATKMGAKLTSNSWGGGGFSQALYDAIAASGKAGMLFIAAAGNDGTNNDTGEHYPSNYDLDNIISVAATTNSDSKSSFSNFGRISVDLGAPGSDIYSTLPGNKYGTLSGTSMATPHVTGVAALIWAQYPTSTHIQVKSSILFFVDPISALDGITVTGGRLNAFKALSEPDSKAPDAVTNLATTNPASNSITLAWTATGDDGATGKATKYDIRYSASPINQGNFDSATQVSGESQPQTAGSRETFTVNKLAFNTTYYFALKVFDEWGNVSAVSNSPSAKTLGTPNISITPNSLHETLSPGKSSSQSFAISNIGEGTLSFDLSIQYTSVNALSGLAQKSNGEMNSATAWKLEVLQANERVAANANAAIAEAKGNQAGTTAPTMRAAEIWQKQQQAAATAGVSIYAVVLDGLGTYSANARLWDELNANWSKYGDKQVLIDYAKFHAVEITYDALAASKADILIISNNWNPTQPYGAFSVAEAKAIARYVNEGAGLYVSAGTFDNGDFSQLQSHVDHLAPLVGLSATEKYFWSGTTYGPLDQKISGHPIWRNVASPYTSGWKDKTLVPSNRTWTTTAIPKGTLIGLSQNGQTAAVVNGNRVFYSGMAELSSGTEADKQFFYNMMLFAGSRRSWLSVTPTNGTVSAGQNQSIAVTFDAAGLDNSDYQATIVIASNDPDSNPSELPVTLKVGNGAQPEVSVTWCSPSSGGLAGKRDTVFVCVDNVTGKDLLSYQVVATFDEKVLNAIGATSTGTISQAFGAPAANVSVDGQITVGGFGTQPLSGSGALVGLILDVVGKTGDVTNLCFQTVSFNTGEPVAKLPVPCSSFKVGETPPPNQIVVNWCETPMSGPAGAKDTVFVCVDDVAGKNLMSYQMAVTFDKSILKPVGAISKGTLSEAFGQPVVNTAVEGQITVGGFGTQPLSGKGSLVGLIFDVIGAQGKTTNLCLKSVTFNSGNPAAAIPTPCSPYEVSKVIPKLEIAGAVKYHINQQSMNSITMTLSGGASEVQSTDANGNYKFGNLAAGLKYTLTASKTEDSGNSSINCFDAALVAQHAVGLVKLTPQQQKAADVDEDGAVLTFDAALICRFGVGAQRLNDNDHSGQWRFEPANRSYNPLNSSQAGQNYSAILLGDVDGSWKSTALGRESAAAEGYGYWTDVVASAGEVLSLPLIVNSDVDIQAADMELKYDPKVLRFVEVAKTELSAKFQVVTYAEAGHLRVGAYGAEAVKEGGNLLLLRFEIIGQEGDRSPLLLERYQLNDGPAKQAKAELVVGAATLAIPKQFALGQNYPNPFNPETTIRFDVPDLKSKSVKVWLAVYKITGQLVRVLANDERSPGSYQIQWNGRDEAGKRVASGFYFYTMTAGDFKATKKMLMVK